MEASCSTMDRAACAAWADHDWRDRRLADSGTEPGRGFWTRHESRCRRCGRTAAETRWHALPKVPIPGTRAAEEE